MRAATEESGRLRKREGSHLPKMKGVGAHAELKWPEGMVKRELTESLVSGPNCNSSVCAIYQHFFWITACTSTNGG